MNYQSRYILRRHLRTTVLVIVFLISMLTSFWMGKTAHAIPMLRPIPPSPISQEVLVEQLRAIKEMHTAIASLQVIVTAEEANKIMGINYGATKMIYVAHGTVRAGVDLSKLTEDDVQIIDGKPEITLPPAEILDIKLDLERSFVYDVQQDKLGPDAHGLQTLAQKKALREVREAAVRCGVLELAEEQAEQVIRVLKL